MTTRDQIIEKHDGIYRIMRKYFIATSLSDMDWGELKALESELAALKSQLEKEPEMYPEEFVNWLCFGSHPFVKWDDEKGDYYTDELTSKRWSINDLFTYWKDNIKDK